MNGPDGADVKDMVRLASKMFPGFEMTLLGQSFVLAALVRGASKDSLLELVSEEYDEVARIIRDNEAIKN